MTADRSLATFGERLAQRARNLPEKTAIAEGQAAISYAKLDAAADTVACRLLAFPATGPRFVGLLFRSKIAAVKALFGTSRSGAAYVMLDAGDPDARLRFIVRDCAPFVVRSSSAAVRHGDVRRE